MLFLLNCCIFQICVQDDAVLPTSHCYPLSPPSLLNLQPPCLRMAQWVDEYFRGNLITSCVMVSVSGKSFGIWRTVLTGPVAKRKVYYARTPERGIAIAKAYIKRHCRTTGKRGSEKSSHKSQTVARCDENAHLKFGGMR